MTRVLIISQPSDIHSYVIAEMIRRKGGEAVIWYTSDFPMRGTETVEVGADMRIRIAGPEGEIDFSRPFDAVWRRRPTYQLDRDALHPADREYADLGCRNLREGMLNVMLRDAFWANPVSAMKAADFKVMQIVFAREVGLDVPETLFTNDPEEIRAFIRRQGGTIAFKPFRSHPWRDGDQYYMAYTAKITEEKLVADELLQAAPSIYQALVPKAYELRVTFVGDRPFAAKVLSQETKFGQLDWRKAYGELRMEPYELPEAVAEKCRALMKKIGLVFGCFDFIVTEDGRYVFLEVNQMGQFLFVEDYTGMNIGDAFAEFLMQQRTDFVWPNPVGVLSYAEVSEAVTPIMTADSERHVVSAPGDWLESKAS